MRILQSPTSTTSQWGVRINKLLIVLLSTLCVEASYANPEGGIVASGDVTITQTPGDTQIHQTSDQAIINWNSFNIGAGEKTQFNQPSSSSITLNRIDPGQGVSQIYGQITANGSIILVNQAGIYFGPTARVDVASIIASTAGISDANFLAGKYIFDQTSSYNGTIINQGTIIAANHGLVALVGTNVSNEGHIQANLGNVVLASGSKFTVDLAGDGLINFSVDAEATAAGSDHNHVKMRDGVKNTGSIYADGGKILLTAKAASGVVDHVINMSGVAQARSVSERNGVITLSGDAHGKIVVSGRLDASGKNAHEVGGKVKILSAHVHVKAPAKIDVSGDLGGGEILVGGNYQGKGPEQNALTTLVDAGVNIEANALTNGHGGKVIVWSDGYTGFHGEVSAMGGVLGGNGGFVETSGHYLTTRGASVNTSAANGLVGTWLLDPTDVVISTNPTSGETFSSNTYTPNTSGTTVAYILASELLANLASSNITVTTTNASGSGNGDITVDAALNWSSANTLTLNATRNIYINADITATNGGLILSAANSSQSITTGAAGTINVGTFTLSQGQWYQNTASLPSFAATNFRVAPSAGYPTPTTAEFLRVTGGTGTSGSPYQLVDVYGLQGINSANTSGNNLRTKSFILAANIDASGTSNWNSGTGFVPIGNGSNFFTGSLNGQGRTIDGLYLNLGSTILSGDAGLFGNSSGTISNIGLTNINMSVLETDYSYNHTIGGLVGTMHNSGSISDSYATGTITFTDNCAGGCLSVGGLVGAMFNTSSITRSYSGVNLSGASNNSSGATLVGGFIGASASTGGITNSYSSGAVSLTSSGAGLHYAGGFAGYNYSGALIAISYSTGAVSGTNSTLGGFSAFNASTIASSYWDTQTSGRSTSSGGTARTTTQLQTALPSGFSGTNWGIIANSSYPYLLSLYSSTPRAISGTSNLASGATVTLAVNGSNLVSSGLTTGTTKVGANGYYYFLEPNSSIANSDAILTYAASGSANAITIAPTSGGSITGLTLTSNQVNVGNSSNPTISNANTFLGTAKGALSSGILYSISGADLTLNSGISLNTLGSSTYNLDGNITASGGGLVTFNGPVTLAANSVIDTNNAAINFGSTINGNQSLTLNTTGTITFNGIIGGSSALSNLLTSLGSTAAINITGITTTGAQTYNGNISLGAAPTLTGSTITLGASNSNTIINAGNTLTIANSAASTMDAVLSGSGGLTKAGSGTLTLNNANTYTGTTNVNAGVLAISNAAGLGATSSGTTVASGAELDINGVSVGSEVITLNGGLLKGIGTSSLAGNIILSSASAISTNSSSDAFTLNGTINGASALTLSGSGNIILAGIIGGSTPLSSFTSNAGNTTLSNNITTTGAQTYNNAVAFSGSPTLSITGSGNMTFNGSLSGSATVSSSSSANTLSLQDSTAQTWNINGNNSGSVNGSGLLDFSGFGSITGGSSSNSFVFANGSSLSGMLNGGSSNNGSLSYNYSSPLSLVMSGEYSGIVNSGSQITSYANIGSVTGVATLTTPNKSNTVYITSNGAGYINDPFYFSGVSTLIGQGSTQVIFDTNAVYLTSPAANSVMVSINGYTMSFSSVNFSGSVVLPGNTPAGETAIASIIAQATQPSYTSSFGNPNGSQPTSIETDSTASSSTDDNDLTSIDNSAEITPATITVNNNINSTTQLQKQLDIQQRNQSISGGCGH